jgi:hypothetical protein
VQKKARRLFKKGGGLLPKRRRAFLQKAAGFFPFVANQ